MDKAPLFREGERTRLVLSQYSAYVIEHYRSYSFASWNISLFHLFYPSPVYITRAAIYDTKDSNVEVLPFSFRAVH